MTRVAFWNGMSLVHGLFGASGWPFQLIPFRRRASVAVASIPAASLANRARASGGNRSNSVNRRLFFLCTATT